MTNLLIFEPRPDGGALLRGYLRTRGHRISLSSDPAEAVLKLRTGLFDAFLVVGETAPPELAQVDPSGLSVLTLTETQITVLLPDGRRLQKPRRLASIGDLVQRVSPGSGSALPAVVDAHGTELPCRAAGLRLPTLLLEPQPGAEEPFSLFFENVGGASFGACVQRPDGEPLAAPVRLLYPERTLTGRIERAAVEITR